MKHIHYLDAPAQDVCEGGAKGVAIRWVINEEDGITQFFMRVLTFQPGGASPSHSHPWEHQNYIISGSGEVEIDGQVLPLKTGDVVLVPPDAHHQYRSEKGMEMICLIPATPSS